MNNNRGQKQASKQKGVDIVFIHESNNHIIEKNKTRINSTFSSHIMLKHNIFIRCRCQQ